MKKIAVFVEGQSELIFIRNLFLYGGCIEIGKISFECLELHAKEEKQVPYSLAGMEYKKSKDEVESITAKIKSSNIEDATRNNRCQSFSRFFMALCSY